MLTPVSQYCGMLPSQPHRMLFGQLCLALVRGRMWPCVAQNQPGSDCTLSYFGKPALCVSHCSSCPERATKNTGEKILPCGVMHLMWDMTWSDFL